eukprot:CAMPEP_0182442020 /NCGR_PEP_ID=MMETSP1172-20130603/1000_1 /TAXON_ID=708627 /ORGANISM="Timspurckia oligopyrenoides, Strain CCMP3278" /LENGTH=217 /DNA_ID=CAMNT_0024636687 /DNA_START=369 /DNA_END=1022 /DNA_ORIENTATION=+
MHPAHERLNYPVPQRLFQEFHSNQSSQYKNKQHTLSVRFRSGIRAEPRVQTHGDSLDRVKWRSYEAQDYAQVLQRCVIDNYQKYGEFQYVLIIQDDVEFTSEMENVYAWILNASKDKAMKRFCSLSLYDEDQEEDKGMLRASNMVARVWRVSSAMKFSGYVDAYFDRSPVDWLANDFCRWSGNRKTFVMVPNPVRHLGIISTFEGKNPTAITHSSHN